MKGIIAEETLRERGGELPAMALRELVLEATGDEMQADTAYARRFLEETRNDPR